MAYDKNQFEKAFPAKLGNLKHAEGQVRVLVHEVCILVLEKVMATEDIREVPKLLEVLTDNNRKMVHAFFNKFSGFECNDAGEFTQKAKWHKAALANAGQFLASGESIWAWWLKVNTKEKPEAKPLDLDKVTQSVQGFLKKADKSGIQHTDVLVAILGAGFDNAMVMEAMRKMAIIANAKQQAADVMAQAKAKAEQPA